jgi:ABC-2 type transport system ATP-binding protein
MNALEIKNLCKTFPGFSLDHLSLNLPSGCILGLIGENGAGKSTTIKLLLDLIRPDSGTITILGTEHTRLSREDIGVVLDEVGIPECLTAPQVGKVMKNLFKNWNSARYSELLDQFSIPDGKIFKEFSRGMKMKLGIAVAMSHGAKLLILDEATSGLDPVVRDEVVNMLSEFTREEGHSILISSHIVSDLEKLCDYIAFLHKGKLMLFEEKDVLLGKYGIVYCTHEQLPLLSPAAVLHRKENPYGAEVLMLREAVPEDWKISPVSIEELFVFMVKEAK